MRILILLTGKVFAPDFLPKHRVWMGMDLYGEQHAFDRIELVNNLQTIDAIRTLLPNDELIVRHVVNRNNLWSLWSQAKKVKNLIIDLNVDVVHQFWGGPTAWMISRGIGSCPYILSLLGSDLMGAYTKNGKQNIKGKVLRFFSLAAIKKCAHIIVMSKAMKNALPTSVYSKVSVVPEGIDKTKFYPLPQKDARDFLGWGKEELVVIFFNNGNRVKNAGFAYQVIAMIQKELPGVRLVELKGLNHSDLIYYYNAANVLLITSLHEGSNNSLKEALACNCPVVSSNSGDALERLQNVQSCAVVEGFVVADYVNALLPILKQPQRSNGEEIATQLTTHYIANQLLALYKRVIGNA